MKFRSEAQLWSSLTAIFRDVFDDEAIVLSPTTTAADIDDWDSFTNVQLMVAIEQTLGIRFNTSEVGDLRNVGELVGLILRHLSKD